MTFLFQYHFVQLERRTIDSGFPEKMFFLLLLPLFLLAHKMMREEIRERKKKEWNEIDFERREALQFK